MSDGGDDLAHCCENHESGDGVAAAIGFRWKTANEVVSAADAAPQVSVTAVAAVLEMVQTESEFECEKLMLVPLQALVCVAFGAEMEAAAVAALAAADQVALR